MISVGDLRRFRVSRYTRENGVLTTFTSNQEVPFPIHRVFVISGVPVGERRGGHAHREGQQLLAVVQGKVRVVVRDRQQATETFFMGPLDEAVHVPAGLWLSLDFLEPQTVVTVFSSHPYDAKDYIRDWEEFLR